MKALKPSAKENKRYLLIRGKNLKKNVEPAILEFIGILGMGKIGLSWIKSGKDSAVIGVNREMVDSVRGALCVSKNEMAVERVSGTLKGLKG